MTREEDIHVAAWPPRRRRWSMGVEGESIAVSPGPTSLSTRWDALVKGNRVPSGLEHLCGRVGKPSKARIFGADLLVGVSGLPGLRRMSVSGMVGSQDLGAE
jgi:hypothetical protein